MKKIVLYVIFFLTTGCASTGGANRKLAEIKINQENELMAIYEKKEVGRFLFFTDSNFEQNTNIFFVGTGVVGSLVDIKAAEGVELYLPQNQYTIYFDFQTKKQKAFSFNIENGKTSYYKWDNYKSSPIEVQTAPLDIKVKVKGSPYSKSDISRIFNEETNFRLYFDADYSEPVDGIVRIKVRPRFPRNISKLSVNGENKSANFQEGFFEVKEPVVIGENNFEITLASKQDTMLTKNISVVVLSSEQIKMLNERRRQEQIAKERELSAKKLEEERIAREGDGSAEDLLCKKYGFKPQTNGYAECRMKIDFAQAESKRQQEQYEREQREYERQLAAVERENERRRGAAFLELGARMIGGQRPIEALGSLGTGTPIAPTRPAPINQTITLPGGRMINCTTMGTMTNCF